MDGILLKALRNKQPIQMIYLDSKQQLTQRKVIPYELSNNYLKGYCFLRKETRLFVLDNILSFTPDSHYQRYNQQYRSLG